MTNGTKPVLATVAERGSVTDDFLYHSHARQFLRAAQQLSGQSAFTREVFPQGDWPTVYDVIAHLFAHSIELSLKGYLLKKEKTHKAWINDPHNLAELSQNCSKLGLAVPKNADQIIKILSPYHSKKDAHRLRYAQETAYKLPIPYDMNRAAEALLSAVTE